MSYVSNVILSFSIMENCSKRVDDVESYFKNLETRGFVDISESSSAVYGGTKCLETPLLVGAFNYLNFEDFTSHLQAIQWESPEDVQLIVKDQEDERFSMIRVFPEKTP